MGQRGAAAQGDGHVRPGQHWCIIEAVADHRHDPALRLQAMHQRQLVFRRLPRMQLVQAQCLAHAAHCGLAVATGQVQRQAQAAQLVQRLRGIGARPFLQHEPGPGALSIAQPQRAIVGGAGGKVGTAQAPGLAVDHALHPAPGHGLDLLCRDGGQVAGSEGGGQRMAAVALQCGGDAQRLFAVEAVEHLHRGQHRPAVAEGAGLVEHDVRGAGQAVQRVRTQCQQADLGQCAMRGRQRGRHRQRQRAGAADHQQGQGDFQRARRFVLPPPGKHRRGHRQQHQHEAAADAVCAAGQRGAVGLGLFDQPRQLRDAGGRAGAGHLQPCRALAADRAGVDRVAGELVHRRRFAGQQRLLEPGFAIHQAAVGRHRLAGGHAGQVAGLERGQRHGFAAAIGQLAGGEGRARTRQRIDLGAGHGARALFKHARGQQQEHEHHRRVVPHVFAAADGFPQAGEVGQQDRA